MELKDVIEMITIDITAEGAIGTICALLLLIGMFFGGGLEPILDVLIGKI